MDWFNSLSDFSLWGNTAYAYAVSILVFFGLISLVKIFQVTILAYLRRLSKKTETDVDDVLITVFSNISKVFYLFVPLWFASQWLVLAQWLDRATNVILVLVLVYEVVHVVMTIIDYGLKRYSERVEESGGKPETSKSMVTAARIVLKILVWTIAITVVLSNLGINVTSLIASLGIGGIAIALALQNILGDIFSSFSIYIDKPFEVGDYVMLGTDKGTVEKIGLKSTRLRTPQGEQLIVSNKELTTVRIQNFHRMTRRRVHQRIVVEHGPTVTNLRKLPKVLKSIVKDEKKATFDRCHFAEFVDSGLAYELVYYVDSSEYKQFMDVREKINFAIYKVIEKNGFLFAYPTRTLLVHNED